MGLTLSLLSLAYLSAYQFPTVSIYDPLTIGAGNQNWMIIQLDNEDMVIANERGLLTYNGAQWKLYPSSAPNAICVVEDRIYSGGYMDMGYWEKLSSGDYKYHSFIEQVGIKILNDEQFWNIVPMENGVIYQSLDRLIFFDERTEELTPILVKKGIKKLFHTRERVYFQDINNDLYVLNGRIPELYFSASNLPSSAIINLFSTDYGILLFTEKRGFFKLQPSGFVPWRLEDSSILESGDFYSAQQLNNGNYALGSITRGLFLLDHKGALINHLYQYNNLSDNTILNIFEDNDNNLWLGLNNGINVVHLGSPFREYIDKRGRIGTVYAAASHKGILYVGTNQGLFYKPYNSQVDFRIVKNSNGQVWSLYSNGEELFCCHNHGTFKVENDEAFLVADVSGTWKMTAYPGRDDFLVQGCYDGIHLLSKKGGKWQYEKELGPFTHSFRQFSIVSNKLYFFHSTLGLNVVTLDSDGNLGAETDQLYSSRLIEPTSLAGLGDELLFSTENGLFRVLPGVDSLDEVLFNQGGPVPSLFPGRLIKTSIDEVVLIQGSELYFLALEDGKVTITDILLLNSDFYKSKGEFENISVLDSSTWLLGMTNGYLLIDREAGKWVERDFQITINSIAVNPSNEFPKQVALDHNDGFPSRNNNFTFQFNVHSPLKYPSVVYQYKLESDITTWSEWTKQATASFYKLKPGPYVFKVRARVGDQLSTNTAEFKFWIRDPWYASRYAWLIYFLLFVFVIFLVNQLYRRVYRERQNRLIEKAEKEMQYIKLKAEQELIQEKNERLKSEIESKNKELAVTAMSMVKKNEFLIEIREHLKDVEPTTKFKPDLVIRSINREIENEESWEMLKNAFENVDKDFFRTLLDNHPELTPNDLKLCTYLRLNLNSKEIATLLNISVRSMETKRYRLRKKLGLSHETNLVEFILAI